VNALKHLNTYFLKYKWYLLSGTVITIIARLFLLYTPRYVKKIFIYIEQYFNHNISEEVFKTSIFNAICYIILASVIGAILTFFMRQTIINMSRYIEFDLKNEIYSKYQTLSLEFYKQNRIGDLMNRITEDVSKVRMYTGPAIMYSINTITLFIMVLSYMVKTSPKLTLYTVLPLPILSIIIYKLSKEIHKRNTIVQEYLSKLSAFTQEAFGGISIIKAYHTQNITLDRFTSLSEKSKEKQIDLTKVQAWFFPMMILLIGTSNLLVIYIGGMQYIKGEIESIGIIAEFIIYVNMLTWPVATVGWVTSIVQQAEASQKRINEFLNTETDLKSNDLFTSKDVNGHITFENVSFTYSDTNIKALKNISFSINSGQTLAILGKTGSGKSTILDLISAFYNVDEGYISIDNIPISKLSLECLRDAIGYVPQDAFLFSDTIENNIKFGKYNATKTEILEASKQAHIHNDIITFNESYDTVLGERGITLSGGQKQRLCIARAIIKHPKILLLDDCLSAIDTETESYVLSNLEALSKNITTIIVSHRVSSIKHADKIIVLDNGNIIQQGTHEALINIDGYYKSLYAKQLKESP